MGQESDDVSDDPRFAILSPMTFGFVGSRRMHASVHRRFAIENKGFSFMRSQWEIKSVGSENEFIGRDMVDIYAEEKP